MKSKKAIVWDMLGWMLIALIVLIVLIALITMLKGKGDGILDRIKDLF